MGDIRPEDLEKRRDGRNIDSRLGVLAGEGAQQRVRDIGAANPAREVLRTRPSQSGVSAESPSYYGQPAIKEPVWIWSIPLYFYVGGVAGAASVLGAAADSAGGDGLKALGRKCRWVGTVGDIVSSGLLIYDLGRPERFLNMLRVFRPTSPMSVGSWVLVTSGAMNTASLLFAGRRGWLGRSGEWAARMAGLLGLPLSGYTAVLISNTAVPVWQATRKTLPLLFMSSAAAGVGSLLELLPHSREEERVLRLFGTVGKVGELMAGVAVQHDASRLEVLERPLKHGPSGRMWMAAKACTAASLVLGLWPGRRKWTKVAGALLGTAGAVLTRFAVFHAGKASASDPQATFQPQRQGLGAAEVTGHTHAADGKPLKFPLSVLHEAPREPQQPTPPAWAEEPKVPAP
ncbi:NrfD/PsrC family molybdoenzyme membrane anchor subunit [Vitiosangium sp. GDMCC 1.1324]|uniref:NrfD/PsrC family molybdoenzyme membrane anchor subunit n=1 Tax=Vitiosangium sp. (strain GDMCC 1.1324) TaxID=2138576 RepID=UPI000D36D4F4|nr:NrfD/PsrC family molybdoenzyme membrane anchor subunit [Vitiosangium sp. GDMCC 1.1324]PTL79655.1 formate dehydrogenase [Vitiosangium sp. GDMCC 1.1324]